MITQHPVPIPSKWTIPSATDRPTADSPDDGLPAHLIARTLGNLPLAGLVDWRIEIAAVAADLAATAGLPWPFDDDDATIVLLRALGRLAVQAPDVTSTLGAPLLEALARR